MHSFLPTRAAVRTCLVLACLVVPRGLLPETSGSAPSEGEPIVDTLVLLAPDAATLEAVPDTMPSETRDFGDDAATLLSLTAETAVPSIRVLSDDNRLLYEGNAEPNQPIDLRSPSDVHGIRLEGFPAAAEPFARFALQYRYRPEVVSVAPVSDPVVEPAFIETVGEP